MLPISPDHLCIQCHCTPSMSFLECTYNGGGVLPPFCVLFLFPEILYAVLVQQSPFRTLKSIQGKSTSSSDHGSLHRVTYVLKSSDTSDLAYEGYGKLYTATYIHRDLLLHTLTTAHGARETRPAVRVWVERKREEGGSGLCVYAAHLSPFSYSSATSCAVCTSVCAYITRRFLISSCLKSVGLRDQSGVLSTPSLSPFHCARR